MSSKPSQSPSLGQLECGDIFPLFQTKDHCGEDFDLDSDQIVGQPTLLAILIEPDEQKSQTLLIGLQQRLNQDAGQGGQVFVLARQSPGRLGELHGKLGLGFGLLADPEGSIVRGLGIGSAAFGSPECSAFFIVLRANRHIAGIFSSREESGLTDAFSRLDAELEGRPTQAMSMHPPVLIIPDVLSPSDCQRLITVFNLEGNEWVEPGHGDQGKTSDYKMRIPEYGRGDRVDHWVINSTTRDFISSRLNRRLFPEIRKAFHYKITKAETYRIAHYEGERGGESHGHRDDKSALVAHRRFAMSINLNSENFAGGELRFSEFGDQRYRPDTGAAIVFSSSLLHEVTQVTSGERFVLLAFLFGDH